MRLSSFIQNNLDAIVAEWETFARTLDVKTPLSPSDLRDHCRDMLIAIVKEMETAQTTEEQAAKSQDLSPAAETGENSAAQHGALRQIAGFDANQLVGEFRALRASVLALWKRTDRAADGEPSLQEFTRFNEALDKVLAESVAAYAKELAASRDMFLAVLGHDLRSPLSVIDMSSVLLGREELPAEFRNKTLMRIARAAREMNRLITDLLEYTRPRLGSGIPIERSPCDLRPLCEQAIDSMRASHPGHQFELQTSGDLVLDADAGRIQQLLTNLLHNAVQHGGKLSPISLTAIGANDAVVLTFANAGEPIPADSLHAIFEPLVQIASLGSEQRRSVSTSLGLGLFIVQQIALGHGGTVDVTSSAEAGTMFTVRLPRS